MTCRQQVVRSRPANHNLHNITGHASLWSQPANQMSAASLFRLLGLVAGSDVNVTSSSSSVTVAEMMRYVLLQATRHYAADGRLRRLTHATRLT